MADQPTHVQTGDPPRRRNGGGAPSAEAPDFAIERIYVKDLSLENPGAPQSFQMTEAPSIEIGLRTRGEQVAPDIYECVLTITVTATAAGKTVFLVEASQAGLFVIRGVPPSDMQPMLAIHCPNVLFPYARETIADAMMRAGFPAGASRADQLRGAVPAAARADAAAGSGRHQLSDVHARAPNRPGRRAFSPRRVAPRRWRERRGLPRHDANAPTVLYDAPSAKAKALFVYGRDVPVEVLVTVEGWTKVRDVGGTIGWIARQGACRQARCCSSACRSPTCAPIRTTPRPSCFAPSRTCCSNSRKARRRPATTATPGWVKVRHRDGQTGFVRLPQVFGL